MKKSLFFSMLTIFFSGCHQVDTSTKIPVNLGLLVVTQYDKQFETGYAFEARIANIHNQNITFITPTIFIEKLENDGKWLGIFEESIYDILDRDKFFPNENKDKGSYRVQNKNNLIANSILGNLQLPQTQRNLAQINGVGVYMSFIKKDSIMAFSRTMNNVLNTNIIFHPHKSLKGKYRAYCKVKNERLFHALKFWNEKNIESKYELPHTWGNFQFIDNPNIKSDTLFFDIY